jgi:hydroxylamine reductase
MFCYQCQETARNEGCTVRGVCGKTEDVSHLQDLLIWLLKGMSYWDTRARELDVDDPAAGLFVAEGLFLTITNVNFDPDSYVQWIREAVEKRDALRARVEAQGEAPADLPEVATWTPETYTVEALEPKGRTVGVMADPDLDPDVRSLRELLTYGLKGLAAYTDHAYVLEHTNDDLLAFIEEALVATTDDTLDVEEMVGWVLRCGEMGVEGMRLLDEANTGTYGHPEPTQANIGVRPGPAILISGHDLRDLDELLQQTEGTGVNVYTHGEMLPANAYPAFKKYDHFVGNYGGSWWHQKQEFESFGGAILLTTNCLVPPKESYKGRLFTTGLVGVAGCAPHPRPGAGPAEGFQCRDRQGEREWRAGTIGGRRHPHRVCATHRDERGRQGYRGCASGCDPALRGDGRLRRTLQVTRVLHRSRQGTAPGSRDYDRRMRQISL